MYFSVITPTPGKEHEAVRHLCHGAYAEHQWLWRFFPSAEGTPRDYLYRRADQGQTLRFYVVSQRPPVPFTEAWTVRTKPYSPQLDVGHELEFELKANPVVTRQLDGKHKRHDVVMDAKCRAQAEGAQSVSSHALMQSACSAWLKSQGTKHGFSIEEEDLLVEGYVQHSAKQGRLRFSSVELRGRLTVTQPDAFHSMLVRGLGHAKAFGCGLMLVRRPL